MMIERATLQAKHINFGQSEIWLEANGNLLTLATNEVDNVTRRHCPKDDYQALRGRYFAALDQVASLSVADLEMITAELKLRAQS